MAIDLILSADPLHKPLTGVGYYTFHLLDELLACPEIADIKGLAGNQLQSKTDLARLISQIKTRDDVASGKPNQPPAAQQSLTGIVQRLPALGNLIRHYQRFRQSQTANALPGFLLHATHAVAPEFNGKTIVTVHDLSHIRYPATHPRERVRWLNRVLPASLERASHIIAVSEFTRTELLDTGLVSDAKRISVCYNGCDPGFHPRSADTLEATLNKWGLQAGKFILSIATLEPRKNLNSLIDAYLELPAEIAQDHPLVLMGHPGWGRQHLQPVPSRLSGSHRVIVTGYLPRQEMQEILSGAGLFAYLSVYEGFGLPVVEAMASGIPVVTSNAGALAEVSANSGYTLDPENSGTITDAMLQILTDQTNAERCKLLGLARATTFSWQQCARETLDVYRKTMEG